MKKFVIIFLILLGISDTELFSQEISQRQEFNRLLYGLWKGETTGSISKYENLMTMLISPSEMATSAGFYLGEVIMKDFRYLGDDKFECLAKVKNVENGLIKEEWIKAKIGVYNDYLIIDYLQKTTKFLVNNIPGSGKSILIEKKTAYPPELIVELEPSSDIINPNSKAHIDYTIKNIGKGDANMVNVTMLSDKTLPGMSLRKAALSDNYKEFISPNTSKGGRFVIETTEELRDETVTFTLNVSTDNSYSTSKSIVLNTKSPFVRGLPPDLFAELSFTDDNNNGILEAKESAKIFIKITNKGKGNAQELKVSVEDDLLDANLTIGNYSMKVLKPAESYDVIIPIFAGINIKTAEHRLKIKVTEFFGYDMDDAFLILNTFEYQAPQLVFSGLEIFDSGENTYAINENGLLQAGEQATVKFVIQNIGLGDANDVGFKIRTNNPDIYLEKNQGMLGVVKAGQTKEISFIISPNKRVTGTDLLPVLLTLSETMGKGNLTDYQLPISLNTRPPETKTLTVNSDFESLKKDFAKFEYSSRKFSMNTSNLIDIKTIMPSNTKRKNSIAVIFGVENYKELPPAPYATNDADILKEYFQKRLGVEKVVMYKNDEVSGFIFDDVFNPDNGELQKEIVKGQTELFVFYSGHGIPDKSGENIYLFPFDGKVARIETQGYEINKLYENLEKLEAKSVTVFLDACFSGGSRTTETIKAENLVAMKGVKIKPKNNWAYLNNPNFTIFNSSSEAETSLGFDASQTGLFTYFLCAGLQGQADSNQDKKITSGELKDYLFDNVTTTSRKISGLQSPQFFGLEDTVLVEY
jgi:hypothetical protein